VRLQKAAGLQSELKYALDSAISQEPLREPLITASAICDRLSTTGRGNALFSMFRDSIVSVNQEDFAGLDVLHLHWTPGMVNAETIEQILSFYPGLKIIWTLHDMFPFTGGCHHALDCTGFESSCSNCPQIHPIFRQKVRLALGKKISLVEQHPAVTFVSPSKWLSKAAIGSRVLRGKRVEVIPNPIREEFTNSGLTQREAREIAGFDPGALISFVIAEDLSDPNKSVQSFVDALPATLPNGTRVQVVLVGSKGSSIKSTGADVVRLGKLTAAELALLLPAADLLAVPSRVENSPATIWEAAAVGVPSLASSSNPGGQELTTEMGFGVAIDSYDKVLETLQLLSALRRTNGEQISRRAREFAAGNQVEGMYREIYLGKV
jgi:glycosyltransferase involved in cell wall biosynthesis